jgi:transposase-like protein
MKRKESFIKRYSVGLKQHVVEEIEGGRLTRREAARIYGISCSRVIGRWLRQYGRISYSTKIVRVTMKSEAERMKDLEEALADECLRSRLYAAQLKSYEHYVPDLKKKLSTKELKQFEENEKKIETLR